MSTLAERIAAKKKAEAEAAGLGKEMASEVKTAPVASTPAPVEVKKTAEEIAKDAVPLVDANGKPLSGFALIKARKEFAAKLAAQQKEEENAGIQKQDTTEVGAGESRADSTGEMAQQSNTQATTPSLSESQEFSSAAEEDDGEESEAYKNATPEARQAYADIKPRIDSLVALTGEDIKSAMQELKKALMQNPNAVALMLPSDIGQMVIALRKMTGVELAAAKTEPKNGKTKKVKEIALTAEQLEDAWKEL